ncbi:hypothetical protein E0I74_34830, partial [Rhizobium laguerreae]
SSVKRLRFILWSSQMGQSLLQNGLFQRGKVTSATIPGRRVAQFRAEGMCGRSWKSPQLDAGFRDGPNISYRNKVLNHFCMRPGKALRIAPSQIETIALGNSFDC